MVQNPQGNVPRMHFLFPGNGRCLKEQGRCRCHQPQEGWGSYLLSALLKKWDVLLNFHCCNKTHNRSNLRREGLILAHLVYSSMMGSDGVRHTRSQGIHSREEQSSEPWCSAFLPLHGTRLTPLRLATFRMDPPSVEPSGSVTPSESVQRCISTVTRKQVELTRKSCCDMFLFERCNYYPYFVYKCFTSMYVLCTVSMPGTCRARRGSQIP